MNATEFTHLLKYKESEAEKMKKKLEKAAQDEIALREQGYNKRSCSSCGGGGFVGCYLFVCKCFTCRGDGVEWFKSEEIK